MNITCPHCSFSRAIPASRVPQRAVRVVCPRCGERFPLWPKVAGSASGLAVPTGEGPGHIPFPSTGSGREEGETGTGPQALPKAGIWLRLAALLIDGMVYTVALVLLLGGFGVIIGIGGGDRPQAQAFMWLLAFFVVLAFGYLYRVFFIGYCGQTPGKMATRIKVVRCDGSEVGFLAAIFREVLGKFISQLLFGAGYLMVAFDEQKQGLHDKIADTYVIKL